MDAQDIDSNVKNGAASSIALTVGFAAAAIATLFIVRLKRKVTPVSFTVVNGLKNIAFDRGWDLVVKQQLVGGGSQYSFFPKILSGQSVAHQIKPNCQGDAFIVLGKKGALFEGVSIEEQTSSDGKCEVKVQEGRTYRIIESSNPAMTDAELEQAHILLAKEIQRNTPQNLLWPNVLAGLDPVIAKQRTPAQLEQLCQDFSIRPWWKLYEKVKVTPKSYMKRIKLEECIRPGGRAIIDLYWRALDRFPGGNADMFTVNYTINCADLSVYRRKFSNWDGSSSYEEGIPTNLARKVKSNDADLHRVFKALLQAPVDSECTIFDTAMDSDEYDSDWSSVEVLVHIPKSWDRVSGVPSVRPPLKSAFKLLLLANMQAKQKLPLDAIHNIMEYAAPCEMELALRLHQYAVPDGNQYPWAARHAARGSIPASPKQQVLLDSVADLVGMGRVNTFSDAGDGEAPCPAGSDSIKNVDTSVKCAYRLYVYIMPMYFDWPAWNIHPVKGSHQVQGLCQ